MTTDDRPTMTGLRFAFLTISFATLAVRLGADPTAVFFGASVLLLVSFGADIKRIEVAHWITIRFRGTDDDGPSGGDRDD